jgi:UDP-glucuronate decarboxylase
METDSDFHGPVNIGNPNEFTISELASIIYELIPETKSKIEFKDFPKDDPTRRKPDISLAKEKLKWKPKVELKEGLIKTINYFKSIKNENV